MYYLCKSNIQPRPAVVWADHLVEVSRHCLSLGRVHTFGCCEVDSEPSSSVEAVEFFDSGSAVPEEFCSNQFDAINKLILLSELWGSCGSKYEFYISLGYDVIALIHTDVSEEAATCVYCFELWSLSIFRRGKLVSIFQWRLHDTEVKESISDSSEYADMCTGEGDLQEMSFTVNIQRVVS